MTNPQPRRGYALTATLGSLALIGLVGGGAAWAARTTIAGAVVASGNVIVEGQPKSVQHLDGGIVERIAVAQGDRVERGQLLIALDRAEIAANLAIYERRMRDALVLRERLRAELRGKTGFAPPAEDAAALRLGDLSAAVSRQVTLMRARRDTRINDAAQYDEKIAQFENQVRGVQGLGREKRAQLISYREEIVGMEKLVGRSLAPRSRLLALERGEADLRGQLAEHLAEIERLRNAMGEARIARAQIARRFREEAMTELEGAEAQIEELGQQVVATRLKLERVEIRAPVAGRVHELAVYTIGGVVQPGQVVMQIVPEGDGHALEVYVDPTAIDEVGVGRAATIRLPAFNQRTTPELYGTISAVSPASVTDEASGLAFYRVIVAVSEAEAARLEGKALIPGMPVEALIPTSERTVLSYLTKPLVDHLEHAFREE